MKHLYAPWRGTYVVKKNSKIPCVFCHQFGETRDTHNFIIKRFDYCLVMLNIFPYNPGHLMVIPYRHTAKLHLLSPAERYEIMEVTSASTLILTEHLKAIAFNIGVNLGGEAAGGSIPHHLHMHVLPRYRGDTSFLTALAETKQISTHLPELYTLLSKAFEHVSILKASDLHSQTAQEPAAP